MSGSQVLIYQRAKTLLISTHSFPAKESRSSPLFALLKNTASRAKDSSGLAARISFSFLNLILPLIDSRRCSAMGFQGSDQFKRRVIFRTEE